MPSFFACPFLLAYQAFHLILPFLAFLAFHLSLLAFIASFFACPFLPCLPFQAFLLGLPCHPFQAFLPCHLINHLNL